MRNAIQRWAPAIFSYRYFFRSVLSALPLVRYSATAIFSIGAMNIYVQYGNYSIYFQGQTRKVKGPFHKRDDWLKSAENLGASPFQRDLSNDTTSSQKNLTGQSL